MIGDRYLFNGWNWIEIAQSESAVAKLKLSSSLPVKMKVVSCSPRGK